jgi:hypothetical protein
MRSSALAKLSNSRKRSNMPRKPKTYTRRVEHNVYEVTYQKWYGPSTPAKLCVTADTLENALTKFKEEAKGHTIKSIVEIGKMWITETKEIAKC